MNLEVKGVHYTITDETKDYIDKKLLKIGHHKDDIVDMIFTITRDKNLFKEEVNINFRWGQAAHIEHESFELFEGIDLLFDKIEQKIKKEKEKIRKR
ncbi:MAG TPA: ribosome-associated translation inhibitor RaiA [Spirochaetia bacterium]|nr:ribosome-associated translation inhibitor RaiA [Spirochaetia bacterium]